MSKFGYAILAGLFLTTPLMAQSPMPPLDPKYDLSACLGQVQWNVNNARVAAGYAEQFRSENLALEAKVAALEAKLKTYEVK